MKLTKKLIIFPLLILGVAVAVWEVFPRVSGMDVFPPLSETKTFQDVYAVVSENPAYRAASGFVGRIFKGPSAEEGGRGAAAVAIETAEVVVTNLREISRFSGSLRARTQFVLSTKVAARLERINVDVGDTVKKGDVVAVLDDREYVAAVKQAQADLDVARANLRDAGTTLETARRDLERMRTLFANKIASQTENENAETALKKAQVQYAVAQAQIRQRQAVLDTVKEKLDATRISAEWDAQALPPSEVLAAAADSGLRLVGERFVDPGSLLKANDPVISILDLSSLTATVNITEAMYARMKQGLSAAVETDAIPGQTFHGIVERVAPLLNELSRQAEVRIGIPNPTGELKPGMFARVSIEYSMRENAVT
ncbi:MAG: efflux RND transporter periplasmic adaptor subunit, partial [Spirochaetaceae bacterium]|nr:efflux RND transporter periplasmic adaptor subunit [Spirochaetaceae bacterium]